MYICSDWVLEHSATGKTVQRLRIEQTVLKLEVLVVTLGCNLQAGTISHHVGVPSPGTLGWHRGVFSAGWTEGLDNI